MFILLKAIFLGFVVAAPVGPVNLLCMRRTLLFGRKAGIVSGLGSSVADSFYAFIAAYSLTAISAFLATYETESRVVGLFIIVLIAWKIYNSIPKENEAADKDHIMWRHFISAFFLTLTNPSLIFSLIFLFGAIHLEGHPIYSVLGIFIGAMIWWTTLAFGISYIKISKDRFILINKIAAILMLVLGIASAVIKR